MAPEYVDFLNRSKGRSVSRHRKLGRNSGRIVGKGRPYPIALFRRTHGHAWPTGNLVAYRYRIAILSITAIAILVAGVIEWYASLR